MVITLKTRIVLVGGFLGSGKTTMINKLAEHFINEKIPIGVITNDQGEFLVDTEFVRVRGIDVEEVPGGCFCCNFPTLLENAKRLIESKRPRIILAEPVGSCTDLMATVVAPLKAYHGNSFSVAPLIVLVDAPRMLEGSFNKETLGGYLRSHQVEEAEYVLLSKTDLVGDKDIKQLTEAIKEMNPQAVVVPYSSYTGQNLDLVIDLIMSDKESSRTPVDVDYDLYADAEAELGWYNGIYDFNATKYDSYDMAIELLRGLLDRGYSTEDIAHAKVTIQSESNHLKVSLVGNEISVGGVLGSRYGTGKSKLNYNARVVSDPDTLRNAVRSTVSEVMKKRGIEYSLRSDSCFSPGRPNPTYRLV
ncbi:MAG: hypothetical protein PWQ88_1092 [Candidatus Methanomethylophilaceae archaeon]|nr:hypothetical protein [Candidatus Methanomethylophilaceae archaeon]